MIPPVNIAKITPPHLPDILIRKRLLDLLEKNRDKKLILIFGQAAQGKSTLAASYARTSNVPTLWMNLGKEESDPVNFFYLMLHSLENAFRGEASLSFPSQPSGMISPKLTLPWFQEWTRSLFAQISTPLQIIVDNLHHLSPDSRSFQFLQVLLDEAPVHIRFMILSREIPPPAFEFQHLKISQQALILTNEDLAFTRAEAGQFFLKIRKFTLTADQIKEIVRISGGWAGGLVLFAEGLSRLPEETVTECLSEESSQRLKRGIFQYLGQEIFSSLSEEVQRFLVRSSFIDLIEPQFIRELIGFVDARDILREHVRKNLFVESIYEEKKGWLFRYHPLFRDFLSAKFDTEMSEEEKRKLLLKAARLYEERGDLENALKSYLRAKAYPEGAAVMEDLGINLLQWGRMMDLAQWVHSFPGDWVKEHPWLLFYQTMTLLHVRGRENVGNLEKAYALFKQKGDQKGMLMALAQWVIVSIRSGFHSVPLKRLLEEGETLLQSAGLERFQYECAVLSNFMAIGHILIEGNIRRGFQLCEFTHQLAKQLKDVNLQAYAMIYMVIGLVFAGDYDLAEENYRQIPELTANLTYPELRLLHIFASGLVVNHRGRFSETRGLVERLQAEVDRFGLLTMSHWGHELLGSMKIGQGKLDEAEEICNRFLRDSRAYENPLSKGLALRLFALIHLHQGLFKKGLKAAEEAIDIFSRESPCRYELHRVKSILGLLCVQLKDYERAEREFDEVLRYYSDISSPVWIAETHLAIALLQWARGRKKEAAHSLKRGFGIAGERGYEYFFVLGQKYLLDACLLAIRLKVKEAVEYASHLITRHLGSIAEERLQAMTRDPDPSLREKALEILGQIRRSRIPQLRIETLGRFRVCRGDTPIGEAEWDRSQPKHLLMAILASGVRVIPKDLLIEDIWPDAGPAAGDRNLKVALHRLRKSLEPDFRKEFGSSYIHLHDNNVILDQDLCRVDTEEFLSIIKKGEESERGGRLKEALSLYSEAAELYQGDFLPDFSTASWVDRRREELMEKYLDLLYRLARLYEKQGALKKAIGCYQKAIAADPLLEESYQKLMILCAGRGMHNEALRAYEKCKRALKVGLKTKPDAATTSIYEKILEKTHSE